MPQFTYMGTKKAFASTIVEACAFVPDGPLLELFSGLSAVGRRVRGARPIWCNDVQVFSNLFCDVHFKSVDHDEQIINNWDAFRARYDKNYAALFAIFGYYVDEEKKLLSCSDAKKYRDWSDDTFAKIRAFQLDPRVHGLHHLLATTFSLGYLSLEQAIQADSIRAAIDDLSEERVLSSASRNRGLLAYCKALAHSSNSTGHFAQFLTASDANFHRVVQKRKVDTFVSFQTALSDIVPIGTKAWRKRNRVYSENATDLVASLTNKKRLPSVIYADPPYTSDQYSRYYHVLETAILYDYPAVSGKGRYRPGRFSSEFSLASRVSDAFGSLVEKAANIGSALVISYPENGLLKHSTDVIPDMLSRHYKRVGKPIKLNHTHSTMGASKGAHQHSVRERIYTAQH